jgi:hypothetical protein
MWQLDHDRDRCGAETSLLLKLSKSAVAGHALRNELIGAVLRDYHRLIGFPSAGTRSRSSFFGLVCAMADCCGKARSHLLSEISWNSRGRYSIALIAAPSAIAQQAGGAKETGRDIRPRHQRQAERVGTLLHGDPQNVVSAVREVNAEENSQTACGLVNAAYVRGKVLMTVRAKGETSAAIDGRARPPRRRLPPRNRPPRPTGAAPAPGHGTKSLPR